MDAINGDRDADARRLVRGAAVGGRRPPAVEAAPMLMLAAATIGAVEVM